MHEIAEKTGWSYYCVRHWWRRFREGGREALAPEDRRKQRGIMSKFPGVVRFAILRIKKEHPGWGAPVARLQASKDLGIDLSSSYMIGDKLADVEAGKRVACTNILVETGYGEKDKVLAVYPETRICSTLSEAVESIEH